MRLGNRSDRVEGVAQALRAAEPGTESKKPPPFFTAAVHSTGQRLQMKG